MKLKLLLLSGLMTVMTSLSLVHAVTPSAAQIAQFKQLPKAQQEALAKQYGIDISQLNSDGRATKKIENPEVVRPRDVRQKEQNKTQTESTEALTRHTRTSSAILSGDGSTHNLGQNEETEQNNIYNELFEPQIFDEQNILQQDDPLKTSVKPKLQPFGYELFAGSPTTFAPATDVPVPSEYVLGPGDTINIQLFGKEFKEYTITIDRTGTFMLPETGPIQVIGLNYSDFKQKIQKLISEKVIGAKAMISMGEMRSIRIFVLGEAYQPGAYTVSSLSSITHALFVSGGINEVGSLRHIQLKRKGQLITEFDLYDMLLKGDTSKDQPLLPGDVVFIPPVGKTVGIDGAVKRPAIYELKNETNAQSLLALAGGLLTTAYPEVSKLERVTQNGTKTVIDINLNDRTDKNTVLKSGDVLTVYDVLDEVENTVSVMGHIHRAGRFAYKDNLKLLDIIPNVQHLKSNPDLDYGLIIRQDPDTRSYSVLDFSLKTAFSAPTSAANIKLQARDTIQVFSAENKREISELVDSLKSQARLNNPPNIVTLTGQVRFAGEYPLTNNMTIGTLVKAGFDLTLEADTDYALLKRRDHTKNITSFETINFNQQNDLNIALMPQDKLYVFSKNAPREDIIADLIEEIRQQTNKDQQQQLVTISGEVKFPGNYPLVKGMTLKDTIAAAGGLTEASYMKNFSISRFKTNLTDSSEFEFFDVEIKPDTFEGFALQPRDSIIIKRIPDWRDHQTVELMGEFQFPGIYPISKGETLDSLIKRAGGFTEDAFKNAAVFTRQELKLSQQILLDKAAVRLKREIISAQINGGAITSSDAVLNLLDELDGIEASGRMVVTQSQFSASAEQALELQDGDMLIVPRKNQSVSIIGEVYSPTALVYNPDYDVTDYINTAGGFNQIAESSDTYIIKANGKVVTNSGWFGQAMKVEPGDTIVVPTNVDPIPKLTVWKEVTSIIYQTTVAIAAVARL